jgi:hypothetical protein
MCKYTSGYDQSGFRGLAEIDISAETITLHRPSYCSSDDHYFGRPSLLQDGRIAMTHTSYGVAVFDTISKTWSLFSNNNIAGFTADGKELASPSQLAYDDANDMIMVEMLEFMEVKTRKVSSCFQQTAIFGRHLTRSAQIPAAAGRFPR